MAYLYLDLRFPEAFVGVQPLFVFIDPFGPTDVPFNTIAEMLRSPRSEILVNLDADGIDRIYHAGAIAKHETHLASILPVGSWKTLMSKNEPSRQRYRQVLNLYTTGLRNLPNVRYVFAFEMQSSSNTLNYYLVFASQHYKGLEKMKEAMKKMDQTGEYCFSDARVGQTVMFRADDPRSYSRLLYEQFAGSRASYEELRDFALNETPFLNPKKMLKVLELESDSKIKVETISPKSKRPKGTFNEKVIRYIYFSKGE